MAIDPYAACPCGSGKKFKWCCQPIHEEIARAVEQHSQGQHDTALRIMDEVIARHPDNPEPHGQKAQLLYAQGRTDEAENELQKALELNPSYAFGHYLRGRFRHEEGEVAGAALLYRRAVDLYDPTAGLILAEIDAAIFDCEIKLQHPVAARAALEQAIRHDPNHAELRDALEQVFGEQSRFPPVARRAYSYLSPPAGAPAERRTAWQRALGRATTGRLGDAARAFEKLAEEDAGDVAAWYNLGLTRAWLGDNARAVEALDRYVGLESDEEKAGDAWALAEVLRCGQGMENDTDYLEHSVVFSVRDIHRLIGFLGEWEKERRLVNAEVREEEGALSGLILQRVQGLTPEHAAAQTARLGAYLLLVGNVVRLWNFNRAAFDEVVQEFRERLGPALSEPHYRHGPGAMLTDFLSEAMVFPMRAADEADHRRQVEEGIARFFEETWIHRPRVALKGVPPVDAVGHAELRKKLRGVLRFVEDGAKLAHLPYDIDRLRRKLGLLEAEVPAAPGAAAAPDVGALGAAELAGLEPEKLPDEALEQAYQAAVRLDAREVAGKFAKALVGRPPRPERPDRYPWFNHLINLSLGEGNADAALDYINEGEKADCEQNEGRRRNDYEVRRGQVQAKRGDMDAAQDTFRRLIERVPAELRYHSSAAEAMLSARQGARALRFAEEGLAKARQQNNRDAEQQFLDLTAAAKRQA